LVFAGVGTSNSGNSKDDINNYNFVNFGSNTPNIKVTPGSSITVQFWIKGSGTVDSVMGVQRQGGTTQFQTSETNQGNFEIEVNGSNPRTIIAKASQFENDSVWPYTITPGSNIWTFVTLTFTASASVTGSNIYYNWHDWTTSVSVNGAPLSSPSTETAGYIPVTQGEFKFGSIRPGELNNGQMVIKPSFVGSLGTVMIYNRILSNNEIAANYNAFNNRYI
jgi:hypothetical protein